jgi:hypothetical protein
MHVDVVGQAMQVLRFIRENCLKHAASAYLHYQNRHVTLSLPLFFRCSACSASSSLVLVVSRLPTLIPVPRATKPGSLIKLWR